MAVESVQLRSAYRHLYQHCLRAVQYSKPSRFVVRTHLRQAFRESTPETFNQARIDRTLEFLAGAAASRGLEHRIVKNLMMVWWARRGPIRQLNRQDMLPLRHSGYAEFDRMVERLNESMGLCLR